MAPSSQPEAPAVFGLVATGWQGMNGQSVVSCPPPLFTDEAPL